MWVRVDDAITEHPKLLDARSPALLLALQVAALCYCNRNLTDGFIPRSKASMLVPIGEDGEATWAPVIADAVALGIWQEADGGYVIHDYLKYQPSRADSESKRLEVHGAKVAAGRARAATASRDSGRFTAGQDQHNQQSDQHATSPVPVPKGQDQEKGPRAREDSPVPDTDPVPPVYSSLPSCMAEWDARGAQFASGRSPTGELMAAFEGAFGMAAPTDIGGFGAAVVDGCLPGCEHSQAQVAWCVEHITGKVRDKSASTWPRSRLLRVALRDDRRDAGKVAP